MRNLSQAGVFLLISVGAVVIGLIMLILASDRLVASAVRVSQALGLSAVLIGAVVVGLGTSLPELLVSSLAAADGEVDVAMANIVGSNIANVTLVLGSAALLMPIILHLEILMREGLLMFGALILLTFVLFDGNVTRIEGIGLLVGLVVALYLLVRWSKDHGVGESIISEEVDEIIDTDRPLWIDIVIGVIALVATVAGANVLLGGALDVGEELGLSATFLGVMLGVGTSLPELAASVAAARRKSPELVVGNVVGSNLFNSLAVAGVAITVGPAPLADLGRTDIWVMLGVAIAAGAFARTQGKIVRWEGALLVTTFVVFAILTL